MNFLSKKISNKKISFLKLDKDDEAFRYLAWANERSEWLWKIFLKFGICGFFIGHLTITAICMLASWFIRSSLNPKYLYHPYKCL